MIARPKQGKNKYCCETKKKPAYPPLKKEGRTIAQTAVPSLRFNMPIDGSHPIALQKRIGLGKVAASEEAIGCRIRAGVRRLQNQMLGVGDENLFLSGISPPEEEHNRIRAVVQQADNMIGEDLPPCLLYTSRCV